MRRRNGQPGDDDPSDQPPPVAGDLTAGAGGAPLVVPEPSASSTPSGAQVLGGGLWAGVSLLIPHIYTVVLSVVAARFLGPDGTGTQSFIAWVQGSLVGLAGGGVQIAVSRFVGEAVGGGRSDGVRGMLWWAWRVQAPWIAVAFAVMVTIGVVQQPLRAAWLLAATGFLSATLRAVPLGLLRGQHLWKQSSLIGLASGAVSMVATVAVLAAGGGIVGMFIVDSVVSFVATAVAVAIVARSMPSMVGRTRGDVELRQRTTRYAYAATAQTVLTLFIWQRSEFLVLERLSTASQLAFYSVAFGLVGAPARILQGAAGALAPAVAAMDAGEEAERIRLGFARAVRLMLMLSLPITAALLTLGPPAVRALFGQEFAGAGAALVVMAIGFPLAPLYHLCVELLHGLTAVRRVLRSLVLAAVVDAILALALVGRWGAVGAAWANVVAQSTAALLALRYARHALPGLRFRLARLSRLAIATILAGAAAAAAITGAPADTVVPHATVELVVGAAVGSIVFVAASFALKVIPAQEAVWLRRAAGGRFGGLPGKVCDLFAASERG